MTKKCPHIDLPLLNNHSIVSPLRYPGGKSVMAGFVSELILSSKNKRSLYVEPFAGGSGVALKLLERNIVEQVVINDFDPCVHAFWHSVVNEFSDFMKLFESTPINLAEWQKQKTILKEEVSLVEKGFAFFFLNRTNRSGVINGGVIGGKRQNGKYKIDARFNKDALRKKLYFIHQNSARIDVRNSNGKDIIAEYVNEEKAFIYADPPYVEKGSSLYLNHFSKTDHMELAEVFNKNPMGAWMLTYDNSVLIKNLYRLREIRTFSLKYCVSTKRIADELLIVSDSVAPCLGHLIDAWSENATEERGNLKNG